MRCRKVLLTCLLLPCVVYSTPPPWWTATETRIIDQNGPASNYAPVNLGQLKHVAAQAKKHLDSALAPVGKAGSEIDALVAGFQKDPSTNYSPVNLGQLKAVAKPFYDRLRAVGYDTRQNLIAHGYPAEWALYYPWIPATPVTENYSPANLGQLKMVFSFDVAKDSDGDGIPDVVDPDADNDGDGIPNGQEGNGGDSTKKDNPAVQLSAFGFVIP